MNNLENRLAIEGFRGREYDFSGKDLDPREAVEMLKDHKSGASYSRREARKGLALSLCNWAFAPSLKKSGLEELPQGEETKELVIVLHGLGEHGGKFRRLKEMGDIEGERLIVPITYDSKKPFLEYVDDVVEDFKRVTGENDFERVHAWTHSTGSDVLRYAHNLEMIKDLDSALMVAGTTNGYIPGFFDKVLFGSQTDYHNRKKPGSKEILDVLKQPFEGNGLTLLNQNDSLVPTIATVDGNGRNLVVSGMGHVMGTGNNKKGNRLYLVVGEELATAA